MSGFVHAGAAAHRLEVPAGLQMVGFVRQWKRASGMGTLPLEVTALAIDGDDERVVIVGADTVGIQAPEVDVLRNAVAQGTGARPEGVLLNWNHTHLAPPGGLSVARDIAQVGDEDLTAHASFVAYLHESIVEVARAACAALEVARPLWACGRCEVAVNRRERTADGRVILGWHPDGLVDTSVPVLQLRRRDESAIATVVGFGCHTVSAGPEVEVYSADFPGALRSAVRSATGGECIFLQGAGGNVLPRFAFTDSEDEAHRLGRRLATATLHALDGRGAWPTRIVRSDGGSVTPFSLYREEPLPPGPVKVCVLEETVAFPLQEPPGLEEITAMHDQYAAELQAALDDGADPGRLRTLRYHASWAERTKALVAAGTVPSSVSGPITTVRIGDGCIATGPGEIFTEISLAAKERIPADVTLYAGYTNGLVTYFPTAAEFPYGGYEPAYGNRSFGLPTQVTPECERILVETATRLGCALFPERTPPRHEGWLATGALPESSSAPVPERP